MAINHDLFNEITTALGTVVTPSLTAASNACDLYEAYVFAIAVRAARAEGAVIEFRDRDGNVPAVFLFRTSPGSIFRVSPKYCHAEIMFPEKPTLELHVGVYVWGLAKVKHECDVSVIRKTEAERCRNGRCHPDSKSVETAVECKLYRSSRLTIGLGRAFLGLTLDVKGVSACFASNRASRSIQQLFRKHKKQPLISAVPSNASEAQKLTDYFRRTFIDYKLKN
jgi:hypothetical protein